jgi:hypothetical protein
MPTPEATISERQYTHGCFEHTAGCAQELKSLIKANLQGPLSPVHQECLDMICTKIARIAVGDPNEPDHWLDIAGYAMLAHERCPK